MGKTPQVYETRYKEHVIRFTPGAEAGKQYETDGQQFATEEEAKKHIRATFFDDGEPAVKWPRTECFEKPRLYSERVHEQPETLVITGPRTDFGRYASSWEKRQVRTKKKDASGYRRNEWKYIEVDELVLDTPKNRALIDEVIAMQKQRDALKEKQEKLVERLVKVDRKLYGIKGREES